MKQIKKQFKSERFPSQQQGLVLIVTLLALMILLLASVALIRSTDSSLNIAGTMAFKRDLINQAERALPQIQQAFLTGALSTELSRLSDSPGNNYYASVQATNASGIPNVLFAVDGANANNIKTTDGSNIEIRYVIDRICLAPNKVDAKKCTLAANNETKGREPGEDPISTYYPVYRLTLRAIGPKNTESYMQATFSD